MQKLMASPKISVRRISLETGVSKRTIHKIITGAKFHSYEWQSLQNLPQNEPNHHAKICHCFRNTAKKMTASTLTVSISAMKGLFMLVVR
jgi:hypothetical protein